ncbi:MAG: hypothetical protein ACOZIN_06820 [Myxococcota bacterium]
MNRYAAVVVKGASRTLLEAAAEVSLVFGTRCALEEECSAVLLDITGCAHLFSGERGLAEQLQAKIAAAGGEARIAVACGPHIALAVAQARPGISVTKDEAAEVLAPLPLEVLGLDAESLAYLHALGVRRVGELQALPVFELQRRLSPSSRAALALAHGKDDAALSWWEPPSVPQASIELEHGLESLEPLLFVLKGLVDPLCVRLEARGELLAQAELWVKYERWPGLTQREQAWEAVFPAPLREGRAILNVLKLRLEAVGLEAPVRQVRLRWVRTVRAAPRALHLWTKETVSVSALPTLIAELVAELGEEKVGSLVVKEHHAASARSVLASFGTSTAQPTSPWVTLSYAASEPLRVQKAEPWAGPTSGRLLVRRQGVEWWKRGFGDAWDSLAVWVDGLGATAWVDRRGGEGLTASAWLRGWVEG